MKKTVLRAYARLIAEVGARVRKGQDVVIEAELDQPEFVTMVADACYHAGARKVTVTWKHQALEKLAIRRESVKTLQTVEDWERAKLQHYVDTLPCRIYLLSEDPDGLRGVSPAKMARARQGRYSVIKPYRDQMEGRYQWCIAAVPGVAWAKKVFPNETKARAVEKLWEAILHTCRVERAQCRPAIALRPPQQPRYRVAGVSRIQRHEPHRRHDPRGAVLRRRRVHDRRQLF